MVGPPGTGKTLLARAIAGEAGVPFFHTSGSEFEEMLVGAGASRVRDLFEKAKKSAPALIFIDEIDAVARKRGTTVQSSTTEQTLNQILTEMDGFEKNVNIIVIAATNRPDVLDPAILRPGRFDRRVVIDVPDIEGRKQILEVHAKNKPLAADVNLEKIAKRTVGFSGAELENTLNEAAIIAAKAGKHEITAADIEEAATKTTMGPAKKAIRTKRELKLVAVHEAGHAVVSKFVGDTDPVHRVSIISRGMAGGVTEFLPQNDERIITKTKLFSRIVVALGGRAAEDIVLGDITTGASSDIEQATSIARRMVQKFGMSEKLGLIKYGDSNELQYLGYGYGEQRDYSDDTAHMIDEEVRRIMQTAYAESLKILNENRNKLDILTELLLEKEVVEGEDFDKLFEK
jgi:cell division protease FtsH